MPTRLPDPLDALVGARIRVFRVHRKISQTDLAEQIGVTFQQVQKYEKGVNRVGAGRLLEVARVFNIQINALFETHAETSPIGAIAGRAPVHLISDKSALKLLAAYADITDRGIRRGVSQMVAEIARASRKQKQKNANRAA